MGAFISKDVTVTVDGFSKKLVKPDNDKRYLVYCNRRGSDEECMAYAVVASSEEAAEAYLGVPRQGGELPVIPGPLDNLRDHYMSVKPPKDLKFLGASGRMCCSVNRGVPVHFVGVGTDAPVVLFNQFIQAKFDETSTDERKPITELLVRDVKKDDDKCPCPKPPKA